MNMSNDRYNVSNITNKTEDFKHFLLCTKVRLNDEKPETIIIMSWNANIYSEFLLRSTAPVF